ncbi:MAG: methionyl-tRNA formyltransferase [Lachnospiraceae bacterium]|nr:methionyl-tRNA formyltransferase [Lachnospiraceae bacterium]
MKIIYMGTPDFAVNTLQTLIDSRHEVIAVFTQPDKPKGRSGQLQMPPVKELAVKYGIPVYQPVKIREQEYVELIQGMGADVAVVAAFGQILPKSILDAPKYGCINVHASLLPKYRGASPIQQSILDGEKETGVTIMKMDVGMDTGDIILQEAFALDQTETGGELFDKLSVMGGPMVLKVLDSFEDGSVTFTKQDESRATHVKMITKENGHIDWNQSAVKIERMVRGYNPWPAAYTYVGSKMFKIWEAKLAETQGLGAGEFIVDDGSMVVGTGDGALRLISVQLEGKKRMNIADFLRGYRFETNKLG